MKRALVRGDSVCLREEAIAAHYRYTRAKPHVPCQVVDRYGNGSRVVLELRVPWRGPDEPAMVTWPNDVWLADGAGERLWRRKNKLRDEIEAEKKSKRNKNKGGPTK